MFGSFQHSQLHWSLEATALQIQTVLLGTDHLRRWLFPQWIEGYLPPTLEPGLTFTTWIGPLAVDHHVEQVTASSVRLLLSRAVDGVHEWTWGDRWVQSSLEGVSLIPLGVGNTATLLRLKLYLNGKRLSAVCLGDC